jgi:DNA-binding HxlR family transcriptional regulator
MKKQWHIENSIDCPLVAAINIVGGKWKPIILHMLSEQTMRFGELKRNIPPVSQKMLTQQLRELEADGVVHRELYPEVPPRTEYSLTPRGASLRPILQALYAWGGEIVAESPRATGLTQHSPSLRQLHPME